MTNQMDIELQVGHRKGNVEAGLGTRCEVTDCRFSEEQRMVKATALGEGVEGGTRHRSSAQYTASRTTYRARC